MRQEILNLAASLSNVCRNHFLWRIRNLDDLFLALLTWK